MTKFLDYVISPLPIRIIDLKVDRSKLKIKGLTPIQFGHLPGRILMRRGAKPESWALTYIVKGRGTFQVGDGPVQRLEAGCLFWEHPDDVFHYGPDPGEDWDEYYVYFEGSRVQEWLENSLLQDTDTVFRIGMDSKWVRKIETIGDYMESGLADNADRAALLLESLIYDFCLANESRKTNDRPSRKPEFTLQILEDIASSLYQTWDERQIWERNHISRSTLRRIVYQNTGYSLNEYVNRLKISEAKKLLRMTSMQIKEISKKLGFEDAAYFSRLFRKFAGMSAAEFRAKHHDAG
ncbi:MULTISPECIES: AraC family transcriptional regulator [Paenibacillus]|uniref:AraC family transcriptional regulator n=1 Tax=Paenibacillus oceani TaxID=2772510 RepID=A0A927H1Y6_9BACL|nr:AraC family transcriptional regulator [Paenibacillus oceani]MBD2863929.1 AraC family transcriptional regulator [Paenibacillus oceani]MDF2662474.1 transcriptional regulator [Paenibacillus sp.]